MNSIIKYVRNRASKQDDLSPYANLENAPSVIGSSLDVSQNESNQSTNEGQTYTIDSAVEKMGFGLFQIKLSILTGLAWMADAMEMMILSILGPALHCDWLLNEWQKALITTVVFCGMMLSGTMWGKLCDSYGRKACLILCTLFTFYFGALSSFAPVFVWLLILRGLVGFGIGGSPQSVVLYAEFLPSKQRARCVVLTNLFWSLGACLEVSLAIVVMPSLGWRWLLAFSSLPLLIFAVFCSWLPESARYHLASGRSDLAEETLKRISHENKVPLPQGSLKIVKSDTKRGQFADLLSDEHRVTTLILWFIWFANAFCYYGIVLLTTEMFQIGNACQATEASKQNIEPFCYLRCLQTKDYIDLLYTTMSEFPGLFITITIIELLGRKKTMAIDFGVFSIFVFLINICVERPVMIMFLFVARCFISGGFQAAYVYTPEYYPTVNRAVGLGTCSTMARIGAIITPFVAQVLLKVSPYFAISIYAIVGLLAAIASMLLPIETRGRKLEDAETAYDPVVH
ncbi:synaptic vesicle 2-related [Brachionus plicatilis]|uniref:Synaptic vesicle 2-related n=1 Tax=Brachionus plicatilis TaxID=10195 RepID=A0A3M7SQ54_BRAPC|nr:synaptic vesicle 2-related [Brachionus plicatilis]